MNELGDVLREMVLNWKSCQFSFRSIPIVRQDAEILRLASDHIKLFYSDIEEFIDNPASVGLIGIVSTFGRVSFLQLNKLYDGRIVDQIASLPSNRNILVIFQIKLGSFLYYTGSIC